MWMSSRLMNNNDNRDFVPFEGSKLSSEAAGESDDHRGASWDQSPCLVENDIKAARAWTEQHGPEFIQRVRAHFKSLLILLPTGLRHYTYQFWLISFLKKQKNCWLLSPVWGYLSFIELHQHLWIFYIWSKSTAASTTASPHRDTHRYKNRHTYREWGLSSGRWGVQQEVYVEQAPANDWLNLPSTNPLICKKTRCGLFISIPTIAFQSDRCAKCSWLL